MKRYQKIALFCLSLLPFTLAAQDLARFTVLPVAGSAPSPVCIALDQVNVNTDKGRIALFEITASGEKEVPCQLETNHSVRLWFVADHSGKARKYIIKKLSDSDTPGGNLSVTLSEQATTIKRKGSPVLSYNHATVFPPEGVDAKYKKSGFIHPLWSPGGEVLTRIQAPDHYHHYGIWNPWTKTTIDGRVVDFWNLYKGEGTVTFAGYLGAVEGPVYAGFQARQEHIFFAEKNREKVAMNEIWDVRVWDIPGDNITVVDLVSLLNTPLSGGVMLDAYRYGGGIGFRATEKWRKENCTVLTSEGKERAGADGTNARWCITEGESAVPAGRSGILFLSHPSNRMHPEPMRVWPLNGNGDRGDLFFEFCPIRHNDWKLEPLKNYSQRYRMVIFDGKMSREDAEKHWKGFASAPVVEMDIP